MNYVGQTIIAQMGGMEFAKKVSSLWFFKEGVRFSVDKKSDNSLIKTDVSIVLKPDDTYTMTFVSINDKNDIVSKKFEEVYCEDLLRIFEDYTGIETGIVVEFG